MSLDQEKTLAVLEQVANSFPENSVERFAITRGAEAIAFVWRNNIQHEFSDFLKLFHADASEEELLFFRKNGWIE